MRDKLIMIAGIGSSKLMQLLFSFYLSYRFGHGALSTFVLIITLAAAMSSVASLGGAPQIVRAGAYDNPKAHIQSTIGTILFFSILLLLILVFYVISDKNLSYLADFDRWDYLICTASIMLALIFYSIIQSYLSFKQDYKKLGIFSIFIYILPFFIALIDGVYFSSSRYTILLYSISFFVGSCGVLFLTFKKEISFINSFKTIFYENFLYKKIINFLKVALFGFFTMLSLYLAVKYVNFSFNNKESAIFSITFQFFQIGTFLPSVLGSIFIPKLVKKGDNIDQQKKMKQMYIIIAVVWLLFSLLVLYPICELYNFEFNFEFILTFMIMQICVLFSSIQAFYIQNFVAIGNFTLLAIISALWGAILLSAQNILPLSIVYSSVSLLIAYIVSNFLFSIILRKRRGQVS